MGKALQAEGTAEAKAQRQVAGCVRVTTELLSCGCANSEQGEEIRLDRDRVGGEDCAQLHVQGVDCRMPLGKDLMARRAAEPEQRSPGLRDRRPECWFQSDTE